MTTKTQNPETPTKTGTVRLHRFIRAPPSRVYKAFLDADALARWLPPNGFTGHVDRMDARVGGGYHMTFTNFGTGHGHSFSGRFVELTPHTRIRYVNRFDDPQMAGEMTVTIDLKEVMTGTEVTIVQEGIPAFVPVEFATLGWQESIEHLMTLVEAEIPDTPGM